jgi:hypothetical protein
MYQTQSAADNAYGVAMGKQNSDGSAELHGKYEDAATNQKQEFEARSMTLKILAQQAGVTDSLIGKYAQVVEEYKAGNKEYSEVLEIQSELANTTSYLSMRKGLQGVFETAAEVKEEYDKIADTDAFGKIAVANQALDKFGITVADAADADAYMELLNQVTQGSE